MRKKFFCFFIFVFSSLLFAQSSDTTLKLQLSKYLPEDAVTALIANQDEKGAAKLSKVLYNEKLMTTTLIPKSKLVEEVFSTWNHKKTVFMVETLYLYKKPEQKQSSNDSQIISDIVHSVSRLEGIEYYSSSRKKMRTLYEKSFAVEKDSTSKRTKYSKVPDDLTAKEQLVLQKDLTFGEYIYKYSYFKDSAAVGFVCENTEKLKYGIITLVSPYNMNVAFSVLDLGDYLLAYANTRANIARFLGIEKKLKNSFSTRADAIYNWFISEYEKSE